MLSEKCYTHQSFEEIYESDLYFGLHLMGGCVMGVDAAKSVVDPEFRSAWRKTLYIADSSIYPNAPGINPALTIMSSLGENRLANQLTK
ncbi:MAG: GMC oxidoreductase [Chitinophagales bacterium]